MAFVLSSPAFGNRRRDPLPLHGRRREPFPSAAMVRCFHRRHRALCSSWKTWTHPVRPTRHWGLYDIMPERTVSAGGGRSRRQRRVARSDTVSTTSVVRTMIVLRRDGDGPHRYLFTVRRTRHRSAGADSQGADRGSLGRRETAYHRRDVAGGNLRRHAAFVCAQRQYTVAQPGRYAATSTCHRGTGPPWAGMRPRCPRIG